MPDGCVVEREVRKVVEALRGKIRLVSGDGEPCPMCGEDPEYVSESALFPLRAGRFAFALLMVGRCNACGERVIYVHIQPDWRFVDELVGRE
jgi:hypothetical protein